MKALLAVVSCRARPEYRDAIRATWLPLVGTMADVKFFLGKGTEVSESGVILLDCGDGYESLPEKVRAIARWALNNGYDYMLKIDDDVVVHPNNMLKSGYDQYDFVGHRNDSHEVPTPPFGFCYWLSKKSMEIIANSELPSDNFDEGWVRTKLYERGINLHHDPRYTLHFGKREDFVSVRKPPRALIRPRPVYTPVEGAFAWCMYLAWTGYRNVSTERNIKEFHKVFADNVCKM